MGKPFEEIDRIRAEQTRTLYRNAPLGVISAAVVSVLLSLALHTAGHSNATPAFLWSLAISACAVAHLILCGFYWRAKPSEQDWRPWIGLYSAMALSEGLVWCVGAIVLTSPTDSAEALIILLAFAGVTAGGIAVFGPYPPTYIAFLYPAMTPHVVLALVNKYPFYELMAALEISFLIALPLIAWRLSHQLESGLRLQFAYFDLAEDLRHQKELAERANLEKSQFLAAVSHDLRQPIHAMGLFIGALQNREMDGEARRLVSFINGSIDAMGALFNALLDISKLDAGAVQPDFETVALRPILERLCREFAGDAEAGGIFIRCRTRRCFVRTDPVLLESVLRNLISNAVRYTQDGGILVGCRVRAQTVVIEVWDTGCGIAADQSDLIFREFYQIGNPERDRAKGAGLGLAIVRRTCALLGADLRFVSRLGRGSVFRVTALRERDEASPPPPAPDIPVLTGTAPSLIYVVDDDLAVQQSMTSLLTSWGHRTVIAGSGAELEALIAIQPAAPDLVISDYRLRGAETGVEVIRRLQLHFGIAIPAILVTGDTDPARVANAHASGFVLLHKPISNGRLRAAIGNLLRKKSD